MKKVFFSPGYRNIFAACQQDKPGSSERKTYAQSARTNALASHWFALDFCSRAAQYGSVHRAMNSAHKPYAYSLSFNRQYPTSGLR